MFTETAFKVTHSVRYTQHNVSKLLQFNLFCDVCAASQMFPSLLTAGGVTVVPVLSCEGLSLRVEAAVHHSDQVMLTESPLRQCHGPQARRLRKRQTQLIKHLSSMLAFTTCIVNWQ